MARPAFTRVVEYLTDGTTNLADSVERLNRDLDSRDNNPHWGKAVLKDTLVILSPRRWLPFGKANRSSTFDDLDASPKTAE